MNGKETRLQKMMGFFHNAPWGVHGRRGTYVRCGAMHCAIIWSLGSMLTQGRRLVLYFPHFLGGRYCVYTIIQTEYIDESGR